MRGSLTVEWWPKKIDRGLAQKGRETTKYGDPKTKPFAPRATFGGKSFDLANQIRFETGKKLRRTVKDFTPNGGEKDNETVWGMGHL